MKTAVKKSLALTLSLVYFTTQIALANQPEMSIWKERRQARTPASAQLVAAPTFSAFEQQLLAVKSSIVPPNRTPVIEKHFETLPADLRRLLEILPRENIQIADVFSPERSAEKRPVPVIVLQDVHMNTEAQSNIGSTLQRLIEKNPVQLVGVEGAFAPFTFEPFRSGIDRKVLHEAAEDALMKNELAAPSYAGLTSAAKLPLFTGIDDAAHYQANVDAYLASRLKEKNVTNEMTARRAALNTEKNRAFTAELKTFDALKSAYENGTVGLGRYAQALLRENDARFPNLSRFLEAYNTEQELDFEKVESERRAVVRALGQKLTPAESADLVAQSLAYRRGEMTLGRYYEILRDTFASKGVALNSAPAFKRYLRYVIVANDIRPNALFEEIEKRENEIQSALATTPEQKKILAESEHLALTRKLTEFALTPKEWERYQLVRRMSHDVRREGIDLTAFEEFYRQADVRSEKMVLNLFDRSTKDTAAGTIVLIVGGFHTPAITAMLRERKTPFIVATPRISKIDGVDGSAYLSVFAREKTPLEKLFSGEKLFLAPRINIDNRETALRFSIRNVFPRLRGVSRLVFAGTMVRHFVMPKTPLQAMISLSLPTTLTVIGTIFSASVLGKMLLAIASILYAGCLLHLRFYGVAVGRVTKLYPTVWSDQKNTAALHFNNTFASQRKLSTGALLQQIAQDVNELADRIDFGDPSVPFESFVLHSHLWSTSLGKKIQESVGVDFEPAPNPGLLLYERVIDIASLSLAFRKFVPVKEARTLIIPRSKIRDLAIALNRATRNKPTLISKPSPQLKISVAVPVYREFSNGNIFRMLASFANQNAVSSNSFEIILNVNNSSELASNRGEGFIDNQLTLKLVAFLRLRNKPAGWIPSFVPEQYRGLVEKIVQSGLVVHALDNTAGLNNRPDILFNTVGNVATARFDTIQTNGFVWFMEADTTVTSNSIAELIEDQRRANIDAVVPDMKMFFGGGGSEEDFKRTYRFQLGNALGHLWSGPLSKAPAAQCAARMIVRSRVFSEIGGFSEGSSTDLLERIPVERTLLSPSFQIQTADRVRSAGEGFFSSTRDMLLETYYEPLIQELSPNGPNPTGQFGRLIERIVWAQFLAARNGKNLSTADERKLLAETYQQYGFAANPQWVTTGKLGGFETDVDAYLMSDIKQESFVENLNSFISIFEKQFPAEMKELTSSLLHARITDALNLELRRSMVLQLIRTLRTTPSDVEFGTRFSSETDSELLSLINEPWFLQALRARVQERKSAAQILNELTELYPDWLGHLDDARDRRELVHVRAFDRFMQDARHRPSPFQKYLEKIFQSTFPIQERASFRPIGMASIFDPVFRKMPGAYAVLTVFGSAWWETRVFHQLTLTKLPVFLSTVGFDPALAIGIGLFIATVGFAFAHTIVAWILRAEQPNRASDLVQRSFLGALFCLPHLLGLSDPESIAFHSHSAYNAFVLFVNFFAARHYSWAKRLINKLPLASIFTTIEVVDRKKFPHETSAEFREREHFVERFARALERDFAKRSTNEILEFVNKLDANGWHAKTRQPVEFIADDFTGVVKVGYQAEGYHKMVFRMEFEKKNNHKPFEVLVALKRPKTEGDISQHEIEWLKILSQETDHTPVFGFEIKEEDSEGPIHYFLEEFVKGPTARELKDQGLLTQEDRAGIVRSLLTIAWEMNAMPQDMHAGNFVVNDAGGLRAVMVDIGKNVVDLQKSLLRVIAFYGNFGYEGASNQFIFELYDELVSRAVLKANFSYLQKVVAYDHAHKKMAGETSAKKRTLREERDEPTLKTEDRDRIIKELSDYLAKPKRPKQELISTGVQGGVLLSFKNFFYPEMSDEAYARHHAWYADDIPFLMLAISFASVVFFLANSYLGPVELRPDVLRWIGLMRWTFFLGAHLQQALHTKISSRPAAIIATVGLVTNYLPITNVWVDATNKIITPMIVHFVVNRFVNRSYSLNEKFHIFRLPGAGVVRVGRWQEHHPGKLLTFLPITRSGSFTLELKNEPVYLEMGTGRFQIGVENGQARIKVHNREYDYDFPLHETLPTRITNRRSDVNVEIQAAPAEPSKFAVTLRISALAKAHLIDAQFKSKITLIVPDSYSDLLKEAHDAGMPRYTPPLPVPLTKNLFADLLVFGFLSPLLEASLLFEIVFPRLGLIESMALFYILHLVVNSVFIKNSQQQFQNAAWLLMPTLVIGFLASNAWGLPAHEKYELVVFFHVVHNFIKWITDWHWMSYASVLHPVFRANANVLTIGGAGPIVRTPEPGSVAFTGSDKKPRLTLTPEQQLDQRMSAANTIKRFLNQLPAGLIKEILTRTFTSTEFAQFVMQGYIGSVNVPLDNNDPVAMRDAVNRELETFSNMLHAETGIPVPFFLSTPLEHSRLIISNPISSMANNLSFSEPEWIEAFHGLMQDPTRRYESIYANEIKRVAILTRNRADAVGAVEAYAKNFVLFGHGVELTVVDDSTDDDARATREIHFRQLAKEFAPQGVRIIYFGPVQREKDLSELKQRLLSTPTGQRLEHEGGLDRAVDLALGLSSGNGSNRNIALYKRIPVQIDDDVLPFYRAKLASGIEKQFDVDMLQVLKRIRSTPGRLGAMFRLSGHQDASQIGKFMVAALKSRPRIRKYDPFNDIYELSDKMASGAVLIDHWDLPYPPTDRNYLRSEYQIWTLVYSWMKRLPLERNIVTVPPSIHHERILSNELSALATAAVLEAVGNVAFRGSFGFLSLAHLNSQRPLLEQMAERIRLFTDVRWTLTSDSPFGEILWEAYSDLSSLITEVPKPETFQEKDPEKANQLETARAALTHALEMLDYKPLKNKEEQDFALLEQVMKRELNAYATTFLVWQAINEAGLNQQEFPTPPQPPSPTTPATTPATKSQTLVDLVPAERIFDDSALLNRIERLPDAENIIPMLDDKSDVATQANDWLAQFKKLPANKSIVFSVESETSKQQLSKWLREHSRPNVRVQVRGATAAQFVQNVATATNGVLTRSRFVLTTNIATLPANFFDLSNADPKLRDAILVNLIAKELGKVVELDADHLRNFDRIRATLIGA